ncbi:MAG: gamma carbonic anhydrase family protein [Halanaerobiales bacterium]
MIKPYQGNNPQIAENVFTGEGCKIIGNVIIKSKASIWYNAVLRGDIDRIYIGRKTNIQENCSLHIDFDYPLELGNNITTGHGAILHGCTVEDNCLIGMGSTILNGAVIGQNSIIGAGTVVTENKKIPPESLVLGVPGKVVRKVTAEEIEKIKKSADHYYILAQKHQKPY